MSGMTSSPSDSNALPGTVPPAAVGAPTPAPAVGAKPRVPLFSADAWAPLKVELFRSLWIATSIAQIGTWAREAAGPWLMKVLTDGWPNQPAMVGRVLVFSNLPICLFSVFAGALADVLDRRQLLIVTQVWMLVFSALLGVLTLLGVVSPLGLLGLTFLLGVGTAAFGPALQAVLPELVPRKDFALAINMNSVALNVARAVGPALFILVVSVPGLQGRFGVGATFLLTAASFVATIVVLWRWKRPPQRAAVHGEEMWDAIAAGWRYTIHSPANRAILLRVLTFIVPAVVLWSQVPIIAVRQLDRDPAIQRIHHRLEIGEITAKEQNKLLGERQERVSALLFAFVGMGAIVGVLLMPGLHGRYRIDPVVNVCIALFASGLIALSLVHVLWLAAPILLFLGVNWVIIPTNFNTATQKSVPPWVKGRAISFYLTVLFGSFAVGGAIWGPLTQSSSISTSLRVGGISMAAMLVLAYWFPLTLNEGLDLGPAFAGGPGSSGAAVDLYPGYRRLSASPEPASGPVQITIEYRADPSREAEFFDALHELGRQRRRNGAVHWRVEDGDAPGRYREVFGYPSQAEHARQSGRMTKADWLAQERVRALLEGAEPPVVRHGPGEWPTTSDWLVARLEHGLERTLEEIGNSIDRLRRA